MYHRIICLAILCLGNIAIGDTSSKPVYLLSFSSQETNGIPINTEQEQFGCSSQIYSIINTSNLAEPTKATVIWRNPSGQIQEQTPIRLNPVEGKAHAWAWLKLHKASGAALLSFIDDSIGMDEFIGDWIIELNIENKKVAKASFNVLC